MKLLSAPSLNKTVSVLPKLSINETSHPIPNIQMPEEDTQHHIEEFVDEASAKFYLYDEEEEHKKASNALGKLMEIKHLHDSAQKTPKSYSSDSLISYLARNNQAKAKTNEINKLKSEIIDLYNKSSSASASSSSDTFVSNLGKQIKELDELCGRNKEKLESLESKRKNKFLLNELEGLLNDSNKLNFENRKTASSMSAIKFKLDQVNISSTEVESGSKKKNFNLFNSSKLSPDMNELIKQKLDAESDQNEALNNEVESDSEQKNERNIQKNVYITNFDKILIKKTQEEPDDECYVRGRGRGKFLCVECGIRKRKLCELKKHLFTHAKYRPFMCTRCCVSFKTKGNLVKHVKTKAHLRRCVDMGMKADDEMITKITLENIDNNLLSRQLEIDKKVKVSRTDLSLGHN